MSSKQGRTGLIRHLIQTFAPAGLKPASLPLPTHGVFPLAGPVYQTGALLFKEEVAVAQEGEATWVAIGRGAGNRQAEM